MRFDHAAIVLLATLLVYQTARAQDPLHIPSGELSIPGVAQKSTIGAPIIDSSAYATALSKAEALATQFKEAIPHTRSALDVPLFRQVAPSVVLVRTNFRVGRGGTGGFLGAPGGNITGISLLSPELDGKRQDILIAFAGRSW
jgi:hypothetical protein